MRDHAMSSQSFAASHAHSIRCVWRASKQEMRAKRRTMRMRRMNAGAGGGCLKSASPYYLKIKRRK